MISLSAGERAVSPAECQGPLHITQLCITQLSLPRVNIMLMPSVTLSNKIYPE